MVGQFPSIRVRGSGYRVPAMEADCRRILAAVEPELGEGFKPHFARDDWGIIYNPIHDALKTLADELLDLLEWLDDCPSERAAAVRRIASALSQLADLLDQAEARPRPQGSATRAPDPALPLNQHRPLEAVQSSNRMGAEAFERRIGDVAKCYLAGGRDAPHQHRRLIQLIDERGKEWRRDHARKMGGLISLLQDESTVTAFASELAAQFGDKESCPP
jgi:hypothetical protein